jgi:hypothetical protein
MSGDEWCEMTNGERLEERFGHPSGEDIACDGCGSSGFQWRGDTAYICMVCGGVWASMVRQRRAGVRRGQS